MNTENNVSAVAPPHKKLKIQFMRNNHEKLDVSCKILVLFDFKDNINTSDTLNKAIEAVGQGMKVVIVPEHNLPYWKKLGKISNGATWLMSVY